MRGTPRAVTEEWRGALEGQLLLHVSEIYSFGVAAWRFGARPTPEEQTDADVFRDVRKL